MDIVQIITGGLMVGIVSAMWWDVRTIRKDTHDKLEKIQAELSSCLLSVAKEYASKGSVDRLWARVDNWIESDVAYLKGKNNGN